jgi:hypothetical protein
MLMVWGGKRRDCDGLSRRTFLKIGALGSGLTLADLLRQRAVANGDTKKSPQVRHHDLSGRWPLTHRHV